MSASTRKTRIKQEDINSEADKHVGMELKKGASKETPSKILLDSQAEKVAHPWTAYFHVKKGKKFYYNCETKESIWEHPSDRAPQTTQNQKPVQVQPAQASSSRKRKNDDVMDWEAPESIQRTEPNNEPLVDVPSSSSRSKEDAPSSNKVEPELEVASTKVVQEREKRHSTLKRTKNEGQKDAPTLAYANVPWNSHARARYKVQYLGCAIFDTNILINHSHLVMLCVERRILTVIPYSVLGELDGLKRSNKEEVRMEAQTANKILLRLLGEKNYFLEVETTKEMAANVDMFQIVGSEKDEVILKCALRVKAEILAQDLNLDEGSIVFVTDDCNLKVKSQAHGIITLGASEFMGKIGVKETTKCREVSPFRPSDVKSGTIQSQMEDSKKTRTDMDRLRRKAKTEKWKIETEKRQLAELADRVMKKEADEKEAAIRKEHEEQLRYEKEQRKEANRLMDEAARRKRLERAAHMKSLEERAWESNVRAHEERMEREKLEEEARERKRLKNEHRYQLHVMRMEAAQSRKNSRNGVDMVQYNGKTEVEKFDLGQGQFKIPWRSATPPNETSSSFVSPSPIASNSRRSGSLEPSGNSHQRQSSEPRDDKTWISPVVNSQLFAPVKKQRPQMPLPHPSDTDYEMDCS